MTSVRHWWTSWCSARETWCQRWLRAPEFEELYYGPRQSLRGASPDASLAELDPDFAEQIETKLARMKGWPLALLAGKALGCAATELKEWREWVTGEVVPAPPRQHHTGGYPLGDRPLTELPEEEEAELVRRGVVSAEELAAAKARPLAPADSTPDLRYSRRRNPEISPD